MSQQLILPGQNFIVLFPILRKKIGSAAAQLVQQVKLFSANKKVSGYVCEDGYKWIYNTYEQWAEQLGVSVATAIRAVEAAVENGILIKTKFYTEKFKHTLHYRLAENYEKIIESLPFRKKKPSIKGQGKTGQKKPTKKQSEQPSPEPDFFGSSYQIAYFEMSNLISSNLSNCNDLIHKKRPYDSIHISSEPYVFTGQRKSVEDLVAPWQPEERDIDKSKAEDEAADAAAPPSGKALGPVASMQRRIQKLMASKERVSDEHQGDKSVAYELAKKERQLQYKKTYGKYANVPAKSLVKQLCNESLSDKHDAKKDAKNIDMLADWYREDKNGRLVTLVDAFLAVKALKGNVNAPYSATYVLNRLTGKYSQAS